MATRVVFDCDVCGATNLGESARVSVYTGRKMDAAGSMEDTSEQLDLCPACKAKAFDRLAAYTHRRCGATLDGDIVLHAARGK